MYDEIPLSYLMDEMSMQYAWLGAALENVLSKDELDAVKAGVHGLAFAIQEESIKMHR